MIRKYNAEKELKRLDDYYPNSDLSHIYKKYRLQIIDILKTIELIWDSKKLEDKNFKILFNGLKNSWHGIYYEIVGKEINSMVGEIDGIERIITEGINDSKWKVRFNTLVIMKGFKDRKIQEEVIELGLIDESKKVREMATDVKNYWIKK